GGSNMSNDEQEIRALFVTWARATAAGDLETLLGLMSEDVMFLTAGQPAMDRGGFATAFGTMLESVRVESEGQIDELEIREDLAYVRSRLVVTVTPRAGGTPKRRSGPTLTILRKQPGGAWVIARDANMLTAD